MTERSILNEIGKYNFSDGVKNKANEIFQKINKLTRKSKRDILIFKCVHDA